VRGRIWGGGGNYLFQENSDLLWGGVVGGGGGEGGEVEGWTRGEEWAAIPHDFSRGNKLQKRGLPSS